LLARTRAIPERGQHAKAAGLWPLTIITTSRYTKAKALQKQKPKLSCAFSTVAGERGAADAERDAALRAALLYRGRQLGHGRQQYADLLVANALKFPDFIHTQKRHPRTNMRSPTAMWDFWSLSRRACTSHI